ncbi:MAG: glycosyltransferase family 4 protein [Cyanobacteria bacterium J06632_22]
MTPTVTALPYPILLFHPSVAPFIQQTGRALQDAGWLARFMTTLIDDPQAPWQRLSAAVASRLGYDLRRQLSRRRLIDIDRSRVVHQPWGELLRIGASRCDRSGRLGDWVWERTETGFDRWVSRHIQEAAAVYGYEHACLSTFQAAKAQGLRRIYEVPSPEHDFVHRLLQQELEKYPETQTEYHHYVAQHQARRTQRRRQEWELANIVIANSNFTKNAYAAAGLPVDKVEVIPLGAPPVQSAGLEGGTHGEGPMRFLWAGTFSIRKGAHYLLQAWRQVVSTQAQLSVFGAMKLPTTLLGDLPDTLKFSATVPQAELFQQYLQTDVLVFPTLCDGFGQVVTEALAHGIPVITTDRAGAADLIVHGENGLVIPAGDATALADALNWCITHRAQLREMRSQALTTAARWQWSDYRAALIRRLQTVLVEATP